MCVLDVNSDDIEEAFMAIEHSEYPSPDSEILFIENDKIVNMYDPREEAGD
jgi:hypothetical protein